LINYRNR